MLCRLANSLACLYTSRSFSWVALYLPLTFILSNWSINIISGLFKGKKILIGRARMFEDKTMDLDDPGMFALNRLTKGF